MIKSDGPEEYCNNITDEVLTLNFNMVTTEVLDKIIRKFSMDFKGNSKKNSNNDNTECRESNIF